MSFKTIGITGSTGILGGYIKKNLKTKNLIASVEILHLKKIFKNG